MSTSRTLGVMLSFDPSPQSASLLVYSSTAFQRIARLSSGALISEGEP